MNIPEGLLPSLLLPEVYGPWKFDRGFVARQIEQAAADGFYRSVEISRIPESEDRQAIRAVCADHDIRVSTWLTQVIDDEKLDLTTLDDTLRARSVDVLKRAMPEARECGAVTVAFIGGPDPGPEQRQRGYDCFVESMGALCTEAANLGLRVMFEPLDRFAHKKRLVGPTDEALVAFARIRADHPTFGLAFDTAHAALNEEDVAASLALARDVTVNLHLSNAVLDSNDPLYGDHHMMPGAPGFLTLERAAELIAAASRLRIAADRGLPVSIEARARPTDAPQFTATVATEFLKAAFERATTAK